MPNGSWKIARGKGGAQLPLAIVAVLAVVLVLIGKAQSSLFDRARAEFSDWSAPLLETVSAPVGAVSRWVDGIGGLFSTYQDNLRLKQENARLRQWQGAAIRLEAELTRERALLHAVPDPAQTSVAARVIGHSVHPFIDTMILDAGKDDGIKTGEAVVDPRGLIGRVFITGHHTAWVILLTDLNSRIPVMIAPGNAQAILAGDNTPEPYLETVSETGKVHPGDPVVTSGEGGLLPPGLPVGVLVADGTRYRVALLADAASSGEVRIVGFKNPPEQLPQVTPADLPASPLPLQPQPQPPAQLPAQSQPAAVPGSKPSPSPAPSGPH
ncbi:MAG: rod shape-determining protein MreC [Alphaproteobacteria bacterium]|nr:rod shape-determining protein MreC [Alphaproteobacteria bacterium]MDE2012426.1 rod shape-determining protein MreC [Alphaproteobacteria bacterium]MDE2072064.1 rod shape-determining protein MreC [Alphaproteobacteria bacterium]MDE2352368.1 rod shape-determining protein MreC [Alphaproteobacteria bacterium]